jgi:hypothetical protein
MPAPAQDHLVLVDGVRTIGVNPATQVCSKKGVAYPRYVHMAGVMANSTGNPSTVAITCTENLRSTTA